MADNRHESLRQCSNERMPPHAGPEIVEFNWPLHVCKRLGGNGEADAYTIGVWKGSVLESICLFQPLENALAALGSTLKSAGAAEYENSPAANVSR